MESSNYATWILVSILTLHSISTVSSLFPDKPAQILARYRPLGHKYNKPKNTTTKNSHLDKENLAKILKQDELDTTATLDLLRKAMSVRPKKPSRFKEKNRHIALEALKQVFQKKETQKGKQYDQNYKMIVKKMNHLDLDSIAASDLAKMIMSKQRSVRSTNHEADESDYINKEINKSSISKSPQRTLNLNDPNFKEDEKSVKPRVIRSAKLKDSIINKRIEETNKGRDLVLEAVQQLIVNEKTRQRYDLVNPKNSKFSKRQQLLWDRLRIKAAEELLMHPKSLPQRPTERIFDTLKMDLELETPEPTLEPGLFNDFKKRIEKQYYLDQLERGRGRVFMSTLKPYL